MEIDLIRLYQYLSLRYVPSKETIIKNVRLNINFKGITPSQVKIKNYSEKKFIAMIKKTIYDSIEKNIPNEKFGVFISGGLDSTILLSVLSEKSNRTIRTFTMGFGEETDELEDAQLVSNYYGTKHKEIVVTEILKEFPEQIKFMGIPKRNLWGYYLAKFASKYVNIVFDGLGGDELFAGYVFRYQNIKNTFKYSHQNNIQKIKTYIQLTHTRDFIPNCEVFGPVFKGFNEEIVFRPFKIYFNNDLDFINQIFLADLNIRCKYDLIPLVKMNEVNGLITKTPFLCPKLIKLAFEIPPHLKYKNGIGKYILRKAFKDMLPTKVINKKKQGFGPNPLNIWKRELKYWVEKYLIGGETIKKGYINKNYVEKILNKKPSEKLIPHYNKLWDALAFEIWYRLNLNVIT